MTADEAHAQWTKEQEEIVQHIDARWGIANRANYFAHPNVVLAGDMLFNAPFFQLGTMQDMYGAMLDIKDQKKNYQESGRLLSYRQAAALTTLASTAAMGYVLTRIFTGKDPKEMKDLFYPKSGRTTPEGDEERLKIPGYGPEFYTWSTDPVTTASHKLSSPLSMAEQTWNNRNYYGRELYDSKASPPVQVGQWLKSLAVDGMAPIGVQQFLRRRQGGTSLPESLGTTVAGVGPASKSITQTPAEAYLGNVRQRSTFPAIPYGKIDEKDKESQAKAAMRQDAPIAPTLHGLNLSKAQRQTMIRNARQSSEATGFKGLGYEDAYNMYQKMPPGGRERQMKAKYKKASTGEEVLMTPKQILIQKLVKTIKTGNADDREKAKQLKALLLAKP
jgi:hypothetical protein